MKKKIELNKKTIQKLKLKLKAKNERKIAPLLGSSEYIDMDPDPSNGNCYSKKTC
ncbi:MAG TPA: hypothetical protein VFA20_05250 [Myxococcaceae bacterium]|nr:hypothetical protein [Myxococcaceae bacterium]